MENYIDIVLDIIAKDETLIVKNEPVRVKYKTSCYQFLENVHKEFESELSQNMMQDSKLYLWIKNKPEYGRISPNRQIQDIPNALFQGLELVCGSNPPKIVGLRGISREELIKKYPESIQIPQNYGLRLYSEELDKSMSIRFLPSIIGKLRGGENNLFPYRRLDIELPGYDTQLSQDHAILLEHRSIYYIGRLSNNMLWVNNSEVKQHEAVPIMGGDYIIFGKYPALVLQIITN